MKRNLVELSSIAVLAIMLAITGCQSTSTTAVVPESTSTIPPTLSPSEAARQITELLNTNAGCELPCWWGIRPGETSWSAARQFLASFTEVLGPGESRLYTQHGASYFAENFDVQYPAIDHASKGLINFGVVNGVVDLIWILPRGTDVRYKSEQFLVTFGKPEMVWIEVDPDFKIFHFLLYYPSQGITALYEGPAKRGDTHYELCLPEVGPELWLWSPEETFMPSDDQFIGPDFGLGPNGHEKYMRSIEIVGLDSETFYQTFRSADASCIVTPRNLWEAP